MRKSVSLEDQFYRDGPNDCKVTGNMRRAKSAWDGIPMRSIRSPGRAPSYDQVPLISSEDDESDFFERGRRKQRKRKLSGAFQNCLLAVFELPSTVQRLCCSLWNCIRGGSQLNARTLIVGVPESSRYYPANVTRNQKYSLFSFIPLVLYEQFKFFLNLYFLLVALSQFIEMFKIGYMYTYWGPLGFVLAVTMLREAWDDFLRYQRDCEINGQQYKKLTRNGVVNIPSSAIQVSDILVLDKNQRVPADMILLRTSEENGACFIRTDQLDGETDWKLRLAVPVCQHLEKDEDLFNMDASLYAEKPQKDIHSFIGTFTVRSSEGEQRSSLSVDNTLWANTVMASGSGVGVVIYTGWHTRSVMNMSSPKTKVGLLDIEINRLTKILFVLTMLLSLTLVGLKGFDSLWYRYFFRFVLLFSYIIPISLRVNLDMGKVVYSWTISRDRRIPDTIVRSSTIPEELGRIVYLLSDKTGTLTQNEMVFKRLHLGTTSFGTDSMDEVKDHLISSYPLHGNAISSTRSSAKVRRTEVTRVHEAVRAIALCHNVTPIGAENSDIQLPSETNDLSDAESGTSGAVCDQAGITYQAASPDEVALVTWTEKVGLALISRDLSTMTLQAPNGQLLRYAVLQIFPFSSETKRMGIIVRDENTGEITFYLKGADVVMSRLVEFNDWLEEECGNMAREGLRTLVIAKKVLSQDTYKDFEERLNQAKLNVVNRDLEVRRVVESLEGDMQLLALTGVEDKLQVNVRPTLELLSNAGIKVWMLTGDKLETATCIAVSSRLVGRNQPIHTFSQVSSRSETHAALNKFRRTSGAALVITGSSLEVCLQHYESEFVELACQCPAVVVCRCSPDQKAAIVRLLKRHTKKPVAAIGDGGNDVSMIQAADAGIGIVGKEGKQASLASDFSITQFQHVGRLLVWHGRNSYKRSAALSQFVIHRGLIISIMQAVFSTVFYFASVPLYEGFLMVGYATVYTMAPVFSLVLDKDVKDDIALMFPELYKELMKGRSLNLKTFLIWVLISTYQGGMIMYGGLLLFDEDFIHVVAITFTALILTELLMVALTISTWHWLMVVAEFASLALYIMSLALLRNYFDAQYLKTPEFVWKTTLITLVSCLPLYILKYLRRKYAPSSYSKLQE